MRLVEPEARPSDCKEEIMNYELCIMNYALINTTALRCCSRSAYRISVHRSVWRRCNGT